MQRAIRFRLYPTKEQGEKLVQTLEKCRFVYNKLLEGLNKQEKPDRNALQHSIVELKHQFPELQAVHSKTLQYENYRIFSNLKALAILKKNGKKVGMLRFKGKEWFKTFTYNQSGFAIIKNNTRYDKLQLSKIGELPFIMHREIKGKIKQITIKHHLSGKWFASIIAETNETPPKTRNTAKTGIDLGLDNFVYDSKGNSFKAPKYLNKSLDKLKKEQRQLSHKNKGLKNRTKQKIKLARTHEKVTNQRNDFLHKLSRHYINNYGFVAVEKLNIQRMVQNSHFARSISDASWSRFIQMLEYKAESAGVRVVKVDPWGTTQLCSNCGTKVPKSLHDRVHKCKCGLAIDRDYNSAINILRKALLPERQEFTPVEIGPLSQTGTSLVVEAGSSALVRE